MARQVKVEILGDARGLRSAFREAERSSAGFAKGIAKAGVFAATGIAGIVTGVGVAAAKFVEAAQESNKVSKQTAAVLKSTGGAARVSAKQVSDLATAISNKTGIDDEQIQSNENLLLTFQHVRNAVGKGNDVFNQATKTIADMSVAFKESGQAASIQLGKALEDPIKGITALARIGVTFTKQQKDQIKTLVDSGRQLAAQKVILAAVGEQVAGSAAAAATPLDRLRVITGNFAETVGNALLPLVNKAADWLGKRVPGAAEATGRAIKAVVDKVGPFVDQVTRFLSGTLLPKLADVGTKIRDAVLPAIGGLGRDIQRKFDEFKPNLTTFRDNLVAGIKRVAQPVLDALGTALRTGDYGPLGKALGDALLKLLQSAGGLAAKIGGWIRDQLAKVDWEEVGKSVGRVAFPLAIGFTTTLVDGLFTAAKEHPFDTFLFVVSLLGIGKIGGIIAKLLERIPILRAFAPLFSKLNELTGPINRAVGKVASLFGEGFREGFAAQFPRAAKILKNMLETLIVGVYAKVDDALKAGARFVRGLGEGIGSEIGLAVRNVGQLIAAIIRPFARAGGWLVRAGRDIIGGLLGGIRAAMSGIGDVLAAVKNAIIGGLKRLFGIHSPSTVMAGLGGHIITGLIKGLLTTSGALSQVVKSIGGNVLSLLGAIFSGIGKPGGPVFASIQDLGQAMVTARWGPGQWPAFNALEMGEAGWNPFARNPTSGAYGLAQALPPSKYPPAAFSSDPMTAAAAQLQWMIGYISDRYGNPANAYAQWLSRSPHWYGAGLEPTVFRRPTLIGVGERGPETVSVTPASREATAPHTTIIKIDSRTLAKIVNDGGVLQARFG